MKLEDLNADKQLGYAIEQEHSEKASKKPKERSTKQKRDRLRKKQREQQPLNEDDLKEQVKILKQRLGSLVK